MKLWFCNTGRDHCLVSPIAPKNKDEWDDSQQMNFNAPESQIKEAFRDNREILFIIPLGQDSYYTFPEEPLTEQELLVGSWTVPGAEVYLMEGALFEWIDNFESYGVPVPVKWCFLSEDVEQGDCEAVHGPYDTMEEAESAKNKYFKDCQNPNLEMRVLSLTEV
jgi:hypothetical protein